jgi:hypothetical protein
MRFSDLSPEVLQRLRSFRWDRIIEKHEGPYDWDWVLRCERPEFIRVNGQDVLLPVDCGQHPNITILRCIPSEDGRSLTLFLKDTTHVPDPRSEHFLAGFVAVCDRFPGQNFFVAILYHEWFIIRNE